MPGADHISVGELPILHGGTVDERAIGGTQIREHRGLAVPADLDVPARDTGVGQPEVGVLAAADDVAAFPELVSAAAAVIQLQGGGVARTGLCATAVRGRRVAGLLRVGLAVAALVGGRGIARLAVTRFLVARLAVSGLGIPLLAIALLLTVAGFLVPRFAV